MVFTGQQDFEVSSRLISVPELGAGGQIGLYVGVDSRHLMRGGIIMGEDNFYHAFMTNHINGQDLDLQFSGAIPKTSNVKVTLQRVSGRYSLRVANQSRGTLDGFSIRVPEFLMDQKNLHVGIYAYNSRPDPYAKITLRDFKTSVWTNP